MERLCANVFVLLGGGGQSTENSASSPHHVPVMIEAAACRGVHGTTRFTILQIHRHMETRTTRHMPCLHAYKTAGIADTTSCISLPLGGFVFHEHSTSTQLASQKPKDDTILITSSLQRALHGGRHWRDVASVAVSGPQQALGWRVTYTHRYLCTSVGQNPKLYPLLAYLVCRATLLCQHTKQLYIIVALYIIYGCITYKLDNQSVVATDRRKNSDSILLLTKLMSILHVKETYPTSQVSCTKLA